MSKARYVTLCHARDHLGQDKVLVTSDDGRQFHIAGLLDDGIATFLGPLDPADLYALRKAGRERVVLYYREPVKEKV